MPTETQPKHTPEPWRAAPQPGQIIGVHAYTHCVMHGDDSIADTLTEPDARLIAAAPDLLAALKAMVEADDAHWPIAAAESVRNAARAAIAKAEGREP